MSVHFFARRTGWEPIPNPLTELAERLRGEGRLLDLTESNPTRCDFVYEKERLLAALADPSNLRYAPDARGLASARAAVREYYHGRGIELRLEQIWLTAGTSEAYSHLFRLLANPGERVHVPQPGYPLCELLAGLNDLELAEYALRYETTWELDWPALESSIGRDSRILLLLHPNNPTGSYLRADDWRRLQPWAAERGLALVVDEVFYDYALDADKTRLVDWSREPETLTFILNGLSKVAALPQIKLAWMVLLGPAELVEAAERRLELILDTYLNVSAPAQNAASELLATAPAMAAQVRRRLGANLAALDARLAAHPAVSRLRIEGGWYAILRLPRVHSDDKWAQLLLVKDALFLHPGHFYGFRQDGCVVLSLLPPETVFAEGIERLLNRIEGEIR